MTPARIPVEWAKTPGAAFRGDGPVGEIVLSSRVRLARNARDTAFPIRLPEIGREEIRNRLFDVVRSSTVLTPAVLLPIETLGPLEREFLCERHLVSRESAQGATAGVATEPQERLAILVNEEDHLRITALRRGLDLLDAFAGLQHLLREVEEKIPFAFDETWGYLTACPTNLGTGLRGSALVHLPALARLGRMPALAESSGTLGMLLRGTFGEGSEAEAHLFQLSNRSTLGEAEVQILERTEGWIRDVVAREREAREEIFRTRGAECEDRIFRAEAVLRAARLLSTKEAWEHLSWVLLGVERGILRHAVGRVLGLFVLTGEAHVQARAGKALPQLERDAARAALTREAMG